MRIDPHIKGWCRTRKTWCFIPEKAPIYPMDWASLLQSECGWAAIPHTARRQEWHCFWKRSVIFYVLFKLYLHCQKHPTILINMLQHLHTNYRKNTAFKVWWQVTFPAESGPCHEEVYLGCNIVWVGVKVTSTWMSGPNAESGLDHHTSDQATIFP